MPPNNTIGSPGRFCNHIFRNVYASFLAEAGDLAFIYSYDDEIRRLGIPLYRNGSKTYEQTAIIRDDYMNEFLHKPITFNIFVDWLSAQSPEFAIVLFNHFRKSSNQDSIIEKNNFKHRYNTNNDVFVHVRLDDAAHNNPGFSYYDKALSAIGVEAGFISSDSPDHPIVVMLKEKYNLMLFEEDEVSTIMFASTCKHIVLSHGTFSWTIGALAFYSSVYIPHERYRKAWCGDIFRIPGWKVVDD
jgi:hypothetical protein